MHTPAERKYRTRASLLEVSSPTSPSHSPSLLLSANQTPSSELFGSTGSARTGENTPPSQQFSAFSHRRMTQPGKGVEPPFPTCCTSCRCLQQFLLVLSGQLQWQMSSSPLCPLAVLVSIPEQLALLGCWAFYPRPFTVSGHRFSLFKEYFWLK